MDFRQFIVSGIVDESKDIKTFKLKPESSEMPKYKPGNFFLLRMENKQGKKLQRSYSVASTKEEGGLWFCIKHRGDFTDLLWSLKKGDKIEADGPYGTFALQQADKERVFIGGGVGISPLRPMLIHTVKNEKIRAHLFHSAHTFEELVYFDEMQKLDKQNKLFSFHPSISGDEKPENWHCLEGRLCIKMLKKALGTLEGKAYYLCGPKPMVREIENSLEKEGVAKQNIHKEEWG